MSTYSIVVTAQHDAVDYEFFRKAAAENNFDIHVERADAEKKRLTMVLIPYQGTTAIDMYEMTKVLDGNVPLLVTYVVCN